MNRPALTVLGGSASLAFLVLTGNPAHVLMPRDLSGAMLAPVPSYKP